MIVQLQLLRQEQLRLQEEVAEKNKLVRFQQLKIVDMKKALNKELVSLSGSTSHSLSLSLLSLSLLSLSLSSPFSLYSFLFLQLPHPAFPKLSGSREPRTSILRHLLPAKLPLAERQREFPYTTAPRGQNYRLRRREFPVSKTRCHQVFV